MIGKLTGPSSSARPYLLAGVELLSAGGGEGWENQTATVPKLGAGVIFSDALFAEATGRWRDHWNGWRLRHWVVQLGFRTGA